MKIKNILMFCGAILLTSVILVSCGSDDNYDFPGIDHERVYFDKSNILAVGSITKTPIGYIADASIKFSVKSTASFTTSTHVNVAIDESLVASYNKANGTSYVAAPEGTVVLDKSALTILADTLSSKDSVTITVPESSFDKLIDKAGYLIPIVITGSDNKECKASTNAGIRYFLLKIEEGSIRKKALNSDIKGTELSDHDKWKCISATGFNADEFQNLYSGGWDAQWNMSAKKGTFVIDMQETKKVTGFYVGNYALKSVSCQISSDNVKWTDCGSINAADMYAKDWSSKMAIFYGAMPCRYIKITVGLDETNQWIEYYMNLSSFGIYAE